MSATVLRRALRSSGFGRSRTWLVTALLAGGLLVQACSNQTSGSGTPSFPAGTTGHGDGPTQVIVNVATNPNAVELNRRIGITVLVTNFNGRPLEGRHVQLSTTFQKLDQVDGFTDADGKFVTFLFCDPAVGAGSATVVAFVEGTSNFAQVTCGTPTPTGTTGTSAGGTSATQQKR